MLCAINMRSVDGKFKENMCSCSNANLTLVFFKDICYVCIHLKLLAHLFSMNRFLSGEIMA